MFNWTGGINIVESLLLLAAALIALAISVLIAGRTKVAPVVKEISLRDLSALWTKEGQKTIHIAELSPLWREEKLIAESEQVLPELQNPRAQSLQEKYISQGAWFKNAPLQKLVCGRLLQLLDQQGLCPSVVNINGDVEGNWDENTYRILAKTTLLDHSLNVAEQVVKLLSENKAWHVIPDTLVAALGHDLGKLESMRGYLYSLGEHPLAAGRPLAGIPEFKKLSKKEEILRAIKLHHKMPDGLLGKTLKKADQLARQKELEDTVAGKAEENQIAAPEDTSLSPTATNDSCTAVKPTISANQNTKDKAAAAWQPQADIYDEDATKGKDKAAADVPKLMDISSWFDAKQFLNELKPYINKMYGRRFLAFSMPDGHVYFQAKVLEEVARKQAERAGCMEIATMAHKDPTMRQVLLTIVHKFRTEPDVIARGLIKDNFFGGYFEVTRKIGKPIKGYYTPFHANVFGSIAEMEQGKSDTLRNIKKVVPFLGREATG